MQAKLQTRQEEITRARSIIPTGHRRKEDNAVTEDVIARIGNFSFAIAPTTNGVWQTIIRENGKIVSRRVAQTRRLAEKAALIAAWAADRAQRAS
jgi:hypothetical protein